MCAHLEILIVVLRSRSGAHLEILRPQTDEVIRNQAGFAAVIARLNTIDVNPYTPDDLEYDHWVVDLVTNVSLYVNQIHDQPLC